MPAKVAQNDEDKPQGDIRATVSEFRKNEQAILTRIEAELGTLIAEHNAVASKWVNNWTKRYFHNSTLELGDGVSEFVTEVNDIVKQNRRAARKSSIAAITKPAGLSDVGPFTGQYDASPEAHKTDDAKRTEKEDAPSLRVKQRPMACLNTRWKRDVEESALTSA
ncbi:MAG: hypothetical protein M1833_000110 [Piccolia ochrophora]|nr:MAG: hypothetical protein M1833_000110 [Piccolia ochrophora]